MPVRVISEKIQAALHGQVLRKFGGSPDSPAQGGHQYIWPLNGATYPWPSAAQVTTIESDNVGDLGLSLKVTGLDGEGFEVHEDIEIAATPTVLATQFFRVYRALVTEPVSNVGNISINHGVNTLAYIPIGLCQTQQLIGTIPIDKQLLISEFILTVGESKGCVFDFWVRTPTSPFALKGSYYEEFSTKVIDFNPYERLAPLSDYYMSSDMTATGGIAAQMMGYYYPIDYDE